MKLTSTGRPLFPELDEPEESLFPEAPCAACGKTFLKLLLKIDTHLVGLGKKNISTCPKCYLELEKDDIKF